MKVSASGLRTFQVNHWASDEEVAGGWLRMPFGSIFVLLRLCVSLRAVRNVLAQAVFATSKDCSQALYVAASLFHFRGIWNGCA